MGKEMTKYIGAHVSIEGGIFNAPLNAADLGATAFACFTKNQRRWSGKPYDFATIKNFKANLQKSGILATHILAHAGYLINLAHYDPKNRQQSVAALVDEVTRCEQLGIEKIVVHPGSDLKTISEKEALDNVANSINYILATTNKVKLLVENMAGQGGNVCYKFEQLAYLIDKIKYKDRIGVCIDLCHLFAAGYDFTTREKYRNVWDEFMQNVGFKYLLGMHINDSKGELGSRVDRHEMLGKGKLGLATFKLIMQDSRFNEIPLILETPDYLIWKKEIKLLYSLI